MQPQKPLTPLEIQRQLADFARRAKELDAREAYLTERERLLESGPLELKVLEETIRVKQLQADKFNSTQHRVTLKYRSEIKGLEARVEEKQSELAELDRQIDATTSVYESKLQQLAKASQELSTLEQEITERRKYQDEQESLIESMVDEGNATLRGINYEIQTAKQVLDNVKGEIAGYEKLRTEVTLAYQDAVIAADTQKKKADKQIADIQKRIKEANAKLQDVERAARETTDKAQAKLDELNIKSESIMAETAAVRREKAELEEDKRRWNSTRALYDIN